MDKILLLQVKIVIGLYDKQRLTIIQSFLLQVPAVTNTNLDSDFINLLMRFLHDEVHHLLNLSTRVT